MRTIHHEKHEKHETESKSIVYKDESYAIMGACFEVYKEKGCGFLESVYQRCLALEFGLRGIPFTEQRELALTYKGQPLGLTFIPDFVCFDKIIIELKAVNSLADAHRAQVHNYLRATGFRLGILINFGHHPGIEYDRITY